MARSATLKLTVSGVAFSEIEPRYVAVLNACLLEIETRKKVTVATSSIWAPSSKAAIDLRPCHAFVAQSQSGVRSGLRMVSSQALV